LEPAWAGNAIDLTLKHEGLQVPLFDTLVATGPFTLNFPVRAADPQRAKQDWDAAPDGALLDITWEPQGPATVIR
jgi:hypothetical protein